MCITFLYYSIFLHRFTQVFICMFVEVVGQPVPSDKHPSQGQGVRVGSSTPVTTINT